jgi:predicted RNA-binding Zn-ribbon protein involved in translation (DUF1610 family)
MTHDTPDGTDKRRLWCENCALSVKPSTEAAGSECPACGNEL